MLFFLRIWGYWQLWSRYGCGPVLAIYASKCTFLEKGYNIRHTSGILYTTQNVAIYKTTKATLGKLGGRFISYKH